MKENKRKCVKCGSSPAEDSDTKLFRFPKPGSTNSLRCELWAKYCFPDQLWRSRDFQDRLYSQHIMLCHRHFKETDFADFSVKKLHRFASPEDATVTMPYLAIVGEPIAGPSQPLMDITNIPFTLPGPSTQNENVIKQKDDQSGFEKCKKYIKKISELQKKISCMKNKNYLNKLNESAALKCLSKKISPTFALLLHAQIKNYNRDPRGRRWTKSDKITALRLFKRSPSCYRLMRRMFSLPSPTSLKSILKACVFKVGINNHIFNIIGTFAKSQKPENNAFVLMYDEMSIKNHLQYNPAKDMIEGFQDHAEQGRTAQPASYALVFMITGIRRKIKQPVAFYISGSSVTADRLAVLIKDVLRACYQHGINVSATVCDMDGVNRRALNILGGTINKPYFEYNNHEVVALFDPPHLIKCFRNLFLKYNIEWTTDISSENKSGKGIAKWSHIEKFFELDNVNPNYALAPLLRQEHLNPNTKQKMKVKLAVQVFSHTVSAGMYATIGKGLTTDAIVTADFLSKMDKIFDTLNSDTPDLRRGKPFSTNLKNTSPHLNFMHQMKKNFQEMKFIGARGTPPSQEGWVWTLNGVERLWQTLHRKHKEIKSLSTRRLQQDPIENLFGCIRTNCGANCNPTTGQFIGALKTVLLSNIAHIGLGANCEMDKNKFIIKNFNLLLQNNLEDTQTAEEHNKQTAESIHNNEFQTTIDEENMLQESNELQACAYVSGFLLKKFRNDCEQCSSILLTHNFNEMHTFIEYKEYMENKKSLKYPTKSLVLCVESCANFINAYLKENAHEFNLREKITNNLINIVNFDFLNSCTEHRQQNMDLIIKNVFYINIKRFCLKKNRAFAQSSAERALKKKIDVLRHK